jgi:hypothetical protein
MITEMSPSAVGTLARTPLAHALVYTRNKRLTGRFELRSTDDRSAVISFFRGRISMVTVAPPIAYFGSVAYEMGLVDSGTVDRSLLEVAKSNPKRLHGEVLVAMGALTEQQRDDVLYEQFCRKVHHVFSYPNDTQYAFYDVRPGMNEPPMLVDPIAPAWRGLRDHPPLRSIEDVLARVDKSALQMVNEDAVDRARLAPPHAALAKRLVDRPMTVAQLYAATDLPAAEVNLLVYLLVIAKCVEPVSGIRATPSIGEMPAVAAPSIREMPAVTAAVAAASPARVASDPAMRAVKAPSGSITVARAASPAAASPAAAPPRGPVRGPVEIGPDGILERAKKIATEDYFEMLGVDRGASTEAIRAAYFRLSKLWQPEKLPPVLMPFREHVAEILAHMTRAQQTLCDPETRQQWIDAHPEESPVGDLPREKVVRFVEDAIAKGAWADAERESRRLAEADPNDVEALALRAWSAAHGGDAPEETLRTSLAALDRAVNLDRTSERALYLRGCVAKKLGKLDAAFRDFARVVHLNPNNVDAAREVRLFEMRARKGSGEHALGGVLDRLKVKKES